MGTLRRVLFCIGVCLCVYSSVRNVITQSAQEDVIGKYQEQVEKLDEEQKKEHLGQAKRYNADLFRLGRTESLCFADYEMLLNPAENGVMGSIEIPKIKVTLPIYHGTTEAVLLKGVGHIYGSSLPVDTEHTHSLLAGHCGLPEAELFTRLDELEEGDEFHVKICGETTTYRVCAIYVIRPEDTSVLAIQEGRSLISLITCTPYGINTHRLVVTGERKESL